MEKPCLRGALPTALAQVPVWGGGLGVSSGVGVRVSSRMGVGVTGAAVVG